MNLNRIPFLHMNNWIYWGFTMYLFGYFFRNWEKPIPWHAVLISFLYILAICLKSPVIHPDYRSIYIHKHIYLGIFHDIWHCTLHCKDEILRALVYIGNHTMPILILHFSFFGQLLTSQLCCRTEIQLYYHIILYQRIIYHTFGGYILFQEY